MSSARSPWAARTRSRCTCSTHFSHEQAARCAVTISMACIWSATEKCSWMRARIAGGSSLLVMSLGGRVGVEHDVERRNAGGFQVAIDQETLAIFGDIVSEEVGRRNRRAA